MRDVWMYSALCGGILGASLSLSAANLSTPGWGVFELPVLAVPENSRVNLSGLNREAAGTHGFIRVKDGHFVDDRGIPIRFYGTNIAGRSCFLAEDDSKLLAKRLRQLGMNCVRLHMLDDDHPYHLGWMIWENPAAMKFSAKNLRRLDALIAACAAEGIYVNLNLHCSWKYTRPWSELAPLGKHVGYWYPEFKELQKKYALTLLNRINTVRGLRYADDPAIFCMELNNEDSILNEARKKLAGMPEIYRNEFQKQWTEYLRKKYKTDEGLKNAWKQSRNFCVLSGEKGWKLFCSGNARGALEDRQNGSWQLDGRPGPDPWNLAMYLPAENKLCPGQEYTVRFQVRSRKAKTIRTYVKLTKAPYKIVGFFQDGLSVTPEWKNIEYSARLSNFDREKQTTQFTLDFGTDPGAVEIRNFEMVSGSVNHLSEDESLERGIRIPPPGTCGPAERDYQAFLLETEMNTVKDLRSCLRAAGCRIPIISTQSNYGEIAGQFRESVLSDYIDIHDYFQHPVYKPGGVPVIPNTGIAGDSHGGSLTMGAMLRELGKPFVISESNTPAPNEQACDMFPLHSIIYSIQDWDALFTYAYLSWTEDPRLIQTDSFMLAKRSNVLVHLPFAALLCRKKWMPAARSKSILVVPTRKIPDFVEKNWNTSEISVYLLQGTNIGAYSSYYAFRFDPRAEKVSFQEGNATPKRDSSGAVRSEDGSFRMHNNDPKGGYATLNLPQACLVTGSIAGRSFRIGKVTIDIAPRPWPRPKPAYTCISLISLDDLPLERSRRMLLAASGRTEPQNLKWNADRTSIEMYPGKRMGQLPFISEYISFSLTLPGAPFRITPLDPQGLPFGKTRSSNAGTVACGIQDRTLWYLIER